jgi:hypothetical protein
MAGLAIIAVGIVLGVVGGLADQVGIGANDSGDMGGKQIAALVVGLVLVVAGIVVATVLAKDGGAGAAAPAATAATAAETAETPAAGTPVVELTEPADSTESAGSEPVAEAEPVEVADTAD